MLKAGRALLLLEGYVPDDGAQHKTVVDVVSAVLGKEYKNAHDRFIIIDETIIYQFGASLKDLEKKWFAFSKINFNIL